MLGSAKQSSKTQGEKLPNKITPLYWIPTQIDAPKRGQNVAKLKPDQDPIFQSGAEFVLALFQSAAKTDNSVEFGNLSRKRAVTQLIEGGTFHGGFDVGS